MKVQYLSMLALLCIYIFPACQEQSIPEKPNLDREEIIIYLSEMPEFQHYSQESQREVREIYEKKKEISTQEFNIITKIHQKYFSLTDFRMEADEQLFETYKSLTGIDLKEGSPASQAAFEAFIFQLDSEFTYETKDLLNAIFQLESYSLEETEKTLRGCVDPCIISAMQIQASILNQCEEIDEPISVLRKEARIEFEYGLRGCFTSCEQKE